MWYWDNNKKICENYQNVTQGHKVSNWYWENGADRLAQCRMLTNTQFVKNAIHATTVKQSAVKRDMPVNEVTCPMSQS